MRLSDKIEVPPLDPARLARIEERVVANRAVAAPAPRRAPWRLALAACALVAVAGALGWQLRGGDAARAPAPVVATGDGERAALRLGDASLRLGPRTQLSLHELGDGGTRVDLARGRVDCEVAPRRHRPPFVVRAGDVDVRVVGTAYSVEREGEQVRVEVARGRVEVVRAGTVVALVAGQSWRSDEPSRVAASPAEPRPGSGGASPRRPANRGAVETAAQTAAEPATGGAVDHAARGTVEPAQDGVTPAPRDAVEPAPHSPEPERTDRDRAASRPADRPGTDPQPRATARAPALPAGLPPLAPCAADGLDACRRQGLAHGGGVDHASALYSLIHLEVERGLFDRALRHAELYEVRFQRRRPEEATAVRALRELARRAE